MRATRPSAVEPGSSELDAPRRASHDYEDMRRELPSGRVTFLFTDVEGSTKLLHELEAERYADALDTHRRVACGVEVDPQGDAFFLAFSDGATGSGRCSKITEKLASGPIALRIGLHTGTPLVTKEGYVGEDVHVAARVAATAHGGQIVLSSATRILLDERYPLVELGEHRLETSRSRSPSSSPLIAPSLRTGACRPTACPNPASRPTYEPLYLCVCTPSRRSSPPVSTAGRVWCAASFREPEAIPPRRCRRSGRLSSVLPVSAVSLARVCDVERPGAGLPRGATGPRRSARQRDRGAVGRAAGRVAAPSAPPLLVAPGRDSGWAGAIRPGALRPPAPRRHRSVDARDRARDRLRERSPVQPGLPGDLPCVTTPAARPPTQG